ncbi:MAG: D-glycerate dehydrogenase [Myxococcales bacterium]|nr:D-glycerate dehydrogenase [Myxococcales bacterium]
MARIFATQALPGPAFLQLDETHDLSVFSEDRSPSKEEIIQGVQHAEVLISMISDDIDPAIMDAAPQLKIIANYAVGYNNINIDWATRRNIPVLHTPHVLTDASADLAFTLLVATARRVVECDQWLRAGQWQGWKPGLMLGTQITGKTLGIVGMGRIGQALARRARGFEMPILYTNPEQLPSSLEREFGARYVELEELLAQSDFVSLHCPLNPKTHHLINAERLQQMKQGAILINTARGPIVDEEALVHALLSGHIQGAGLDVFEQEPEVHPGLVESPKVILTPHIGSATEETRAQMSAVLVDGINTILQGKVPHNVVNSEVLRGKLETDIDD